MTSKFGTGTWRLEDPKISITSAASMTIGASIVALEGDIDWLWLAITGLAFFCMEVAKNAWGDVYDYDSGTDLAVAEEDRTDYAADSSAGKRNLVVKLGRFRASRILPFIYLSGFTILAIIPGMTKLGTKVWWGFIDLPSAMLASLWVWRRPDTFYRDSAVQPLALLTFVLYPIGICIAIYLMPLAVDA